MGSSRAVSTGMEAWHGKVRWARLNKPKRQILSPKQCFLAVTRKKELVTGLAVRVDLELQRAVQDISNSLSPALSQNMTV